MLNETIIINDGNLNNFDKVIDIQKEEEEEVEIDQWVCASSDVSYTNLWADDQRVCGVNNSLISITF